MNCVMATEAQRVAMISTGILKPKYPLTGRITAVLQVLGCKSAKQIRPVEKLECDHQNPQTLSFR